MKYEVILFDADETLFDFKKSEKEAIKNTFIEFGINYDENYHLKVYQDINSALWKDFELGLITQEKLKTERFKRLSNELNIKFNEFEFAKAYMNHLANGSFLFDDSLNLIESLSKHYKLAIITNGLTAVQKNRIGQSVIANFFDCIVISEEISISKPNPKIFEFTLNKINHMDKSTVLMVGDSLTSDIQGGINFGIDTCWYNPNNSVNNTNFNPTYEVSSLKDLKTLLIK